MNILVSIEVTTPKIRSRAKHDGKLPSKKTPKKRVPSSSQDRFSPAHPSSRKRNQGRGNYQENKIAGSDKKANREERVIKKNGY